jgi:hypothetical protein
MLRLLSHIPELVIKCLVFIHIKMAIPELLSSVIHLISKWIEHPHSELPMKFPILVSEIFISPWNLHKISMKSPFCTVTLVFYPPDVSTKTICRASLPRFAGRLDGLWMDQASLDTCEKRWIVLYLMLYECIYIILYIILCIYIYMDMFIYDVIYIYIYCLLYTIIPHGENNIFGIVGSWEYVRCTPRIHWDDPANAEHGWFIVDVAM